MWSNVLKVRVFLLVEGEECLSRQLMLQVLPPRQNSTGDALVCAAA